MNILPSRSIVLLIEGLLTSSSPKMINWGLICSLMQWWGRQPWTCSQNKLTVEHYQYKCSVSSSSWQNLYFESCSIPQMQSIFFVDRILYNIFNWKALECVSIDVLRVKLKTCFYFIVLSKISSQYVSNLYGITDRLWKFKVNWYILECILSFISIYSFFILGRHTVKLCFPVFILTFHWGYSRHQLSMICKNIPKGSTQYFKINFPSI